MSQQMMWIQQEGVYRGQTSVGAVISVDEDAMTHALRKAGKGIFEADWWIETLTRILEHWGIIGRRWTDEVTGVLRIHFRLTTPQPGPDLTPEQLSTGPLSTRLLAKKKDVK